MCDLVVAVAVVRRSNKRDNSNATPPAVVGSTYDEPAPVDNGNAGGDNLQQMQQPPKRMSRLNACVGVCVMKASHSRRKSSRRREYDRPGNASHS
jgi:hypothetical protein